MCAPPMNSLKDLGVHRSTTVDLRRRGRSAQRHVVAMAVGSRATARRLRSHRGHQEGGGRRRSWRGACVGPQQHNRWLGLRPSTRRGRARARAAARRAWPSALEMRPQRRPAWLACRAHPRRSAAAERQRRRRPSQGGSWLEFRLNPVFFLFFCPSGRPPDPPRRGACLLCGVGARWAPSGSGNVGGPRRRSLSLLSLTCNKT